MILNAAMLIERRAHLAAHPYERSENRNGYFNGFKDSSVHDCALLVTRDGSPKRPI